MMEDQDAIQEDKQQNTSSEFKKTFLLSCQVTKTLLETFNNK